MSSKDSLYGPTLPISQEIHAMKYRGEGESFSEACARFADTLADSHAHFRELYDILLKMKFLGGGRTQAAVGSTRRVTAFNCFVSGEIHDSMQDIMSKAAEAAETMRMGGGIGYDFSTLRPRGDTIVSLDSKSSGPISFMGIYDAVCHTISSAGHRRGAQMAVLRVDHPDIEEFVRAKQNDDKFRAFNISVGITDEFMLAVENNRDFDLRFGGRVYKRINARALWEEIMRSTWEWAEPGVLFIDRINDMNNLWYCETISATNPCGEQPLPPYGACLLGSFNLTAYLETTQGAPSFSFEKFAHDIPIVVRAMDNIHDNTFFPLEAQAIESQQKRRMGLGITGLANAGEILGYTYGSPEFLDWAETVLGMLRDGCYYASAMLAKEKGAFPLYDKHLFNESKFVRTLPKWVRAAINEYGIRNSHLLSIAPTGTISLSADNISSGIEPVFSHYYDRTIQTFDGPKVERVEDWAYRMEGVEGKTATDCTAREHLSVLALAQKYVDSSVSKTINVNPNMAWSEFKAIYMDAWKAGCKGCTTFNPSGKRFGILNAVSDKNDRAGTEAKACYIDPNTGIKSCE